jgi:hypothetical protein
MLKRTVVAALAAVVLTLSLAGIASAQIAAAAPVAAPGTAIVFPKFRTGFVAPGLAASTFEIGVVCPEDNLTPAGCTLPQGTRIKLALEWICPGTVQKGAASFCQSVDFELHTTLFGKLQFDANGNVTVAPDPADVGSNLITNPSCPEGYLIAYVVDGLGRAIKFDGLVGEVVLRERPNSASALAGVTFQADNLALDPDGRVLFRNTPTRIAGDVRYERSAAPTVITSIILLDLNVRRNNDNPNIRMPIGLYRADESRVSTALHWTCWRQVRLTALDGGPFNQARMGEKGVIASLAPATIASACSGIGCGADGDQVGVLAFVQTIERNGASEYSYPLYGQGFPGRVIIFP